MDANGGASAEHQGLVTVIPLKENSFTELVAHWVFFKTHILEKPMQRIALQNAKSELDRKTFYAFVRSQANPTKWGPARAGASSPSAARSRGQSILRLQSSCYTYYLILLSPKSPIQVKPTFLNNRCVGLGVFLRQSVSVMEGQRLLQTMLWGALKEVKSTDEFDRLMERRYPSLYGSAILVGPLSLLNHQCMATMKFSPAHKLILESTPFNGLRGVHAVASSDVQLQAGAEVFLDYTGGDPSSVDDALGRKCLCKFCCSSRRMSASSSSSDSSGESGGKKQRRRTRKRKRSGSDEVATSAKRRS